MKMSRRAKRMQQHYKRKKRNIGLNMVSLMDIFTILVFFLLVNSSDVQELPSTKAVRLPESTAEQKPKKTITIMVNEKNIVVQGRPVATIKSVLASGQGVINPLFKELDYHAKRQLRLGRDPKKRGKITIIGDREIPYQLLKRIMLTCAQANFPDISLAVIQKSSSAGAG